jgi:hypothetical protein
VSTCARLLPGTARLGGAARSLIAWYQGDPLASAAAARRGQANGQPGSVAHAKLAAQEMRCRAMLGDAAGMAEARRKAATAMAQLGPPTPAASVYPVPRAEDPPYTATSLLLAGRYAEAAQMTQQIIDVAYRPQARTPSDQPTNYARTLLILALAAGLGEPVSWQGLSFDFNGVIFDGGNFRGAEFPSGSLAVFDGAEFSAGTVRFNRAKFSGGTIFFGRARFSGGTIRFDHAEFSGGTVSLRDIEFPSGSIRFGGARFSGGTPSFTGARFCGGEVSFSGSVDWSHPPVFSWDGQPPTGVVLPVQPPGEHRGTLWRG